MATGESIEGRTKTARNRFRSVAIAITMVQLGLGAMALWCLWDTKASGDEFVRVHGGERFYYNPAALLVPAALMALFAGGLVSALIWTGHRNGSRLFTALHGLSLAVVAGWWVVLNRMDDYRFFVAAGTLPPNEIMGSSWPLALVVLLFTFAALLGLIPLAWLAIRSRRAKS